MKTKRMFLCQVLAFLLATGIQAQETDGNSIATGTETNRQTEAQQLPPAKENPQAGDEAYQKRMDKVWKSRRRYFNFTYGFQTLENNNTSQKSNVAAAISVGRTFYLHKKPLAGMIKFGLDWTYLDLNFAQYPDLKAPEDTGMQPSEIEIPDFGILQAEVGMGFGPSVTINPVDRLKISAYFRVTPSYSLMVQNSEIYHHYATFFNAGLTVAYKVIALGIEKRWCGPTLYDGVTLSRPDCIYDEEGNFHDPFENMGQKMKTNTFRIFLSFRF